MIRAFAKGSQRILRASPVARACFSTNVAGSVPSVDDLIIKLTFVDPSGARRKVNGLVGKIQSARFQDTIFELCLFVFVETQKEEEKGKKWPLY